MNHVNTNLKAIVTHASSSNNANVKRQSAGIPQNQLKALITAASSDTGTQEYYAQKGAFIDLYQGLKNGTTTWIESKTTDSKCPVFYAQTEPDSQGKRHYITLTCGLNNEAQAENSTANPSYNLTGYFQISLEYASQTYWNSFSDISVEGVSGLLAASELFKAAKALLNKLKDGTSSCISEAVDGKTTEDANASAETGAEEASSTVEIEEGVSVDLEAEASCFGPIAEGVVFTACIFMLISHMSYQNLTIANLTDYNLNWEIVYQDHGEILQEPSSDDESVSHTIAKGQQSGPPGVQAEPSYSDAPFKFESDETAGIDFYGIEYIMSLVLQDDSGATVANIAMFYSVPFSGNNRLYCSFDDVTTKDKAKSYLDNHDDSSNEVTSRICISPDGKFELMQTFDYLSGKHETDDKEQYSYNSLFVVKQSEA